MTDALVADVFRRASGQIIATLTRILGPRHLALAEETAQDALIRALQVWPHAGVPENPAAWLIQVAKRRAFDVLRREKWLADHPESGDALLPSAASTEPLLRSEPAAIEDDELLMMFLACHPDLSRESRVALTLRTACGFSVGEISRALLAREEAVAQRLARAKRQLREHDVSFRIDPSEYPARLESVLDVLYLLFNEGYSASSGDDLIRHELCGEAIRLSALLADHRELSAPTVHALLALMLLQAARFPARTDEADLHRLDEQDRTKWDRDLINGGFRSLHRAAAGETLSAYHVEAEIAACHAAAARYQDTDWQRILHLYDYLLQLKPTPIVALNRAIAISRVHGARAGLSALAPLGDDAALRAYYLLPATTGQLASDEGDWEWAADEFRAALQCQCSAPERRFLERQLAYAEQMRSVHARR